MASLRSIFAERRHPFILTLSLLLFVFLSLLILSTDYGNRLFSSFLLPPKLLPTSDPTSLDQREQQISKDHQQKPQESRDQIAESEDQRKDQGEEELEIEWRRCPGGKEAADYIPCLDNWKAIKALKSKKRMEHRERHCPVPQPRCLVPLPEGYRVPVAWPKSRDMVRFVLR